MRKYFYSQFASIHFTGLCSLHRSLLGLAGLFSFSLTHGCDVVGPASHLHAEHRECTCRSGSFFGFFGGLISDRVAPAAPAVIIVVPNFIYVYICKLPGSHERSRAVNTRTPNSNIKQPKVRLSISTRLKQRDVDHVGRHCGACRML